MPRLDVGDSVHETLPTVWGEEVSIPDPDRLVHLQFRRYAGCPICNLHLRSIVGRLDEITAAGIREVIVFHSTPEAIAEYHEDLPLSVVADPDKELYRKFGVAAARRAVLDPRAWMSAVQGSVAMGTLRGAVGRDEDHFGLPADFLINTDALIIARKYGTHADDQWSVDELLGLAGG